MVDFVWIEYLETDMRVVELGRQLDWSVVVGRLNERLVWEAVVPS